MEQHASDQHDQKKSHSKGVFRFGLKSMLILVFIACVLLAYIVPKKRREMRELAAISAIDAIVGTFSEQDRTEFYYDYQMQEQRGRPTGSAQGAMPYEKAVNPTPTWIRTVLGENIFATIRRVHFPSHVEPVIGEFDGPTELPALISEFTELESLQLGGSSKSYEDLGKFQSLSRLRTIELDEADMLKSLAGVEHFQSLKTLKIRSARKLGAVEELASLPSLDHLTLEACEPLSDLSCLAKTTTLSELHVKRCFEIESYDFLSNHRGLKSLSICSGKLNSFDVSLISKNNNLQQLTLIGFEQVENIELLAAFKTLESIKIVGCENLSSLEPISKTTRVKKLELRKCHGLNSLSGVEHLNDLELVDIERCRSLSDLSALAEIKSLQKVRLKDLSIVNLPRFKEMPNLIAIWIDGFEELKGLDDLEEMKAAKLQELRIGSCKKLSDIEAIRGFEPFVQLSVGECPNVPQGIVDEIESTRERGKYLEEEWGKPFFSLYY